MDKTSPKKFFGSRNSEIESPNRSRGLSPTRSILSTASPSRSAKSPTRSLVQVLLPKFARSHTSITTEQFQQQLEYHGRDLRARDVSNVSLNDFADTSSEGSKSQAELDAESLEDIFKEYHEDHKSFVFKEDFDEGDKTKSTIDRPDRFSKSFEQSLDKLAKDILDDEYTSSSASRRYFDASNVSGSSKNVSSDKNTSSSSERKKYFDTTEHDTNDTLERILQSFKMQNSMISLNSEELLNKLEHKSLNELLEKSFDDKLNSVEPIVLYRVRDNQSPKLIQIGSPQQVHFHDSDISTDNSLHSIEVPTKEYSDDFLPTFGPQVRRPPPNIPIDSLDKINQHEKMYDTSPKVNYNPTYPHFNTTRPDEHHNYTSSETTKINDSPVLLAGYPITKTGSTISSPNITNDYYSDEELFLNEKFKYPKFFTWKYFSVMMIIGLIIPPLYFLLSLGIFDKLSNEKNYYTGIYYKQQYLINHSRVVKFSPLQKTISFFIGLFWFAIILAMIGVGFGLTQ